ncbi:MAG TPA: energy-coupling factor transporter transmembrane component T [Spirochaetia bacterium]|nr:energy-coupling factor transporter transmembrane component T [Spirochaetia bacterium]
MKGFEFLQNITIGQYIPGESFLHRLDPRFKLLAVSLCVATLVISNSVSALLASLLFILAGILTARVPLRYAMRGLRPALPILHFLAALQVTAIPKNDVGTVLARWWLITVTDTDFKAALITVTRFSALILLLSLFSSVTSTKELTHGTELLFRPLQRIGFPAHELALTLTIAIRFLPFLALEAEHIAKAQASRGADFGKGKPGLLKRARRMLPILVPLFLSALRRSETLILAMEARCYTGGRGRTHLIRFKARVSDALISACILLIAGFLIYSNRLDPDMGIWRWITGTR